MGITRSLQNLASAVLFFINSQLDLVLTIALTARIVFLIDAIGAATSAVSLGLVLPRFHPHFQMQDETLYFFASLSLLFFVFSAFNFWRRPKNEKEVLKATAITNVFYSMLTAMTLIMLRNELTLFDFGYFIVEIIAILILSRLEWKTAQLPKA